MITSIDKAIGIYGATPVSRAQTSTAVEQVHNASLTTPTDIVEISAAAREANARASIEAAGLDRYEKTGDVDPEADELAQKIGGVSSVKVPGFSNREFDAISKEYVAQTSSSRSVADKPHNFLDEQHRNQIKATLEAAKQEGKVAAFEYTQATPHPNVVNYISSHAARAGVEYNISDPTAPIF